MEPGQQQQGSERQKSSCLTTASRQLSASLNIRQQTACQSEIQQPPLGVRDRAREAGGIWTSRRGRRERWPVCFCLGRWKYVGQTGNKLGQRDWNTNCYSMRNLKQALSLAVCVCVCAPACMCLFNVQNAHTSDYPRGYCSLLTSLPSVPRLLCWLINFAE